LPGEVAENIRHIRYDREHWQVDIELWSGTIILDHGDSIDIIGDPDDVAVDEVVAAVLRRTPVWDAVELRGAPEFRRTAAWALLSARPDIVIVDCPLGDDEIDAARQGLPPAPPATTAAFLAHIAGGHPVRHYVPSEEQD